MEAQGNERAGPDARAGLIGNPPYDPEPNRETVRTMAKVCGQELIAHALGISVDTIQRHHADDFRAGKREAVHSVGEKLLEKALKGCTPEMIFYLKCHGGEEWRQTKKFELGGPGGGPIRTVDFSNLIDGKTEEELRALNDALSILSAAGAVAGPEDGQPAAAPSSGEAPPA